MDNPNSFTRDADTVIDSEKAFINNGKPMPLDRKLYGLAFSGGGIRSASFALGFMQALVDKDQLKKFDYLSTVSGGGYIGSALTWFLSQKKPAWMHKDSGDGEYFSTSPEDFPFGQKCKGNRLDLPQQKPNAILDFIRQHGNYLLPGQGLNGMALMGYVLRAMIVSLSVYTALLTAFMVAFIDGGLYRPVPDQWVIFGWRYVGVNYFIYLAVLLITLYLLSSFAYSLFTRFSLGPEGWKYKARTFIQRHAGWLLSVCVFLCILGTLRFIHETIVTLFSAKMRVPAAGGSALLGVIGALTQFRNLASGASRYSDTILVGAAALLIYGIALLAYYFGEAIVLSQQPTWWLTTIMVLTMVVISTCVNVNFLGLHRMYRDRLMETFLPNLKAVEKNTWGLATEADVAPLHNMCQVNRRPYHLINTNVVLVDSTQSKFRGRGGDSFLLSPLFCGSDATGWVRSDRFRGGGLKKGITLPTSMAISGAAVNPDTGVDGAGLTRGRIVSTLLSLLNLRLGFWASNPDPDRTMLFPPNFLSPGLKGGVLGGGLREDRRAIELSDGGHFENLGIYELLRRKLSVIVVTDGGADPQYNFGDLANAVEKARVDFGVTIVFNHPDYVLEKLLPGSEEDDYFVSKYKGAKNPFAIASIYYEDNSEGILVCVKATLIKNLPADLIGYKTANPSFPDEPTSDQFFDERKFEAYRELGYCLGKVLLKKNDEKSWF